MVTTVDTTAPEKLHEIPYWCPRHECYSKRYARGQRCPECAREADRHYNTTRRKPKHALTGKPVGRPGRPIGSLCAKHLVPRVQYADRIDCPQCRRDKCKRARERKLTGATTSPKPPNAEKVVEVAKPEPVEPAYEVAGVHRGKLGTHWLMVDRNCPGRGVILFRLHGQTYVYADYYPQHHHPDGVQEMWAKITAWKPSGVASRLDDNY